MVANEDRGSTRQRIVAVALDHFGSRGVEGVSLDEIAAEVGVRKQTILYWFSSKGDLVDEVLARAAGEMTAAVDAAVAGAPDEPLDVVDAVVRAVFRIGTRRPAVLGLVRELNRLSPQHAARLRQHLDPFVTRGVDYLRTQMDAGRLRRGDPGIVAMLSYMTIAGVATEPEALRAVGWTPSPASLRRLRNGVRAYLRAALEPGPSP